MVEFRYKAIGQDGKSRNGVIDAPGPEFVATHLRAQGLTLLKLQEDSEQDLDAENGAFSRAELLSFTTELAVMLRAGLPLDRSLKVSKTNFLTFQKVKIASANLGYDMYLL